MSDMFGEDALKELMEEEFFDEELEEPKACPTLFDDCVRLYEAVRDLINEVRQKPLNRKRVANLSDLVIHTSRQIIAGLRKRVMSGPDAVATICRRLLSLLTSWPEKYRACRQTRENYSVYGGGSGAPRKPFPEYK
jgi:hypothetical protein